MTDPTPSLESLVAEVKELRSRLQEVESRRPRRQQWLVLGLAVAGIAGVAWGQLTTFNADTPALASEVNGNFGLLKAWIEAKVGPVTTPVNGPQVATIRSPSGAPKALNVIGDANYGEAIVDVRHSNQTQGVGIGWAAVFATGTASDVNLNLAAKGAGRVVASEFQAATEYGIQLSCGEASYSGGLQMHPFCCRIDIRTGATNCLIASNPGGTTWPSPSFGYPNFGATTPGRWSLSCVAGAPGASFPFCCRMDMNSGVTQCGQGNSYALGSAGNSGLSW